MIGGVWVLLFLSFSVDRLLSTMKIEIGFVFLTNYLLIDIISRLFIVQIY